MSTLEAAVRKRQPPFGARLARRLETGWKPPGGALWIGAGADAWNLTADLVLPPEAAPESFDWRILRGFDAMLIGKAPRIYETAAAAAMLEAGAVLVIGMLTGTIRSYRPARAA